MRVGRQFFIFCLIVVAATQVLNSALSISSFERVYSRSVMSQYEVLVQELKGNIESGLKKYKSYQNYAGLETIFRKILARMPRDRIDSVLTTDASGRVLCLSHYEKDDIVFRKYEKKDGYFLKEEVFDNLSSTPQATATHALAGAHIISAPVMNGDAWQGNVSIIFSGKFVAEEVYSLIERNLVLFAAILTLCGLLLAAGFPVLLKRQGVGKAFQPGHSEEPEAGKPGSETAPSAGADYRRLKARLTALIVAVLLLSQMAFSYFNLRSFERDYLGAIMDKTELMSTILRENIEYLLGKGLPIDKLVGIEGIMAGIVLRTPEYSSLEILDASGNLLYVADPRARGVQSFRRGQNPDHRAVEDAYTRLVPVSGGSGREDGIIKVVIDRGLIESRIKSVLLDYISVVIVAILISFEISLFFIARRFPLLRAPGEAVRGVSGAEIRMLGFLNLFGSFLFMSFFSLFMKEVSRPLWGLSREFVTGLPVSVYMLAASGGYILKDVIQERFGQRATLFCGSLIFAAGLFLTGTAADVVQVVFAQVLAGIGFGINYLIPQNLVMENCEPARRPAALSDLFAGFYAGIICGSATGGILAERLGYRPVFILSGAVVLLTCAFAYFCLPGSKAREAKMGTAEGDATPSDRYRLWKLLLDGRFMVPLVTQGILYQFVYAGFLFFTLPLFLKAIGFSESDIGRTVMLHGLVIILGPVIIRFLSRRMRPKTQLVAAGLTIGVMLIGSRLLFGFSGFLPAVFFLVPWIVAIAVCNCVQSSSIVPISMSSPIVPRVGTARALSAYRLIERIGNIGGPVLCSLFLGWFSVNGQGSRPYENTMALIGALFLAGTLLFFLFAKRGIFEDGEETGKA